MSFVHLHVHTQYSILDGLSAIPKLFDRAEELGMPALAITDHGNMYGVKEFMKFAGKHPSIKPIIGCEVYVTRHYDHRLKDSAHRAYYHLILLAKNYEGYRNLMKIVSTGHIEGKYYDKPRVTHEIIEKYHENLICCSACLAGEIPRCIVAGDMEGARKAIEWHKRVFGDDYYLEVMLHRTEVEGIPAEGYQKIWEVYEHQKVSNEGIFRLAEETGVPVVATNDVHFIRKEDGPVHDRLICLTMNNSFDDPKRIRYTQQEYLKSEEEMAALFPDHPEVLENTLKIAEKVESYSIDRDHVLPKYEIDAAFLARIDAEKEKYAAIIEEGKYKVTKDKKTGEEKREYRGDAFCNSVAYLCHLTFEGARRRYGKTLNDEQQERIDFELKTISRMGFPDYFLIVQDYIAASRKEGFLVGPGRGSAAGSVVAYCLGITNLDPIRYNLLFERFLNPDRISMPDIDVDFENLPQAHEYVEKRYGADHVSRVITFGTMLAKGAIKDVARISNLSIDESNRLSRMVPDRLSEKVEKEYPFNPKLDELKPGFKKVEKEVEVDDPDNPGQKKTVKKWFQKGMEDEDVKVTLKNCFRLVPEFKAEFEKEDNDLVKEVLNYANQLEGCIRQVGMHACATIIGRGNLTDYIPICLSRDKDTGKEVWTSQFDGHYIEDVGMLKMDFLGLNTLQIIKECLKNIKLRFGKDIDIEVIPIDDKEVYELYGRGDTTSLFQFESPGMREWLQKLHPERFEDLIAMNALYRPGPMDYIPDFVERKQGRKPIEYDLPQMEKFLSETYGITVYQEQVMQLSRELASFTKGEADKLRKAMGKKQIAVMQELKEKFMNNGIANGHPEKTLDKIWKDWEKFAQYAFNKSHATCYAWVSYQTAWLKCHYTAEFLAANLSCNLSDMEELKKVMTDCKIHNVKVLNPDINESLSYFTVNRKGAIRFGLGGLKGFGENVVEFILSDREANGPFKDVWDFMERLSGKVNARSLETLVHAGAFDSLGCKRTQFFTPCPSGNLFIDELVHYADLYRNDTIEASSSLFGDIEEMKPVRPAMPALTKEEDPLELLKQEKEYCGMYLSSHPLDAYAFEIEKFTTCGMAQLPSLIAECDEKKENRKVFVAGMLTEKKEQMSRSGKMSVRYRMEDYSGAYELSLSGKANEAFIPFFNGSNPFLFIEGEIKPMFVRKPGEVDDGRPIPYVLRLQKVSLLENIAGNYIKGVNINLTTTMLSKDFRTRLLKTIKASDGKIPLTLCLFDPVSGYKVNLLSRKFQIAPTKEFFTAVELLGLTWSVDTKPLS